MLGAVLPIPLNGTISEDCVVFYVVEAGDSWRSIAEKYNADLTVLIGTNPGVTPIPGTRVKVPANSAQSTISNVTPTLPVPTQAAGNLAPNPSFEEIELNTVAGWAGNVINATFTWDRGNAYQGERSVCIESLPGQSSGDWITLESIPITPGLYNFHAYVKGDFDQEVFIWVSPMSKDGSVLDGNSRAAFFNDKEWTLVELPLEIPQKRSRSY